MLTTATTWDVTIALVRSTTPSSRDCSCTIRSKSYHTYHTITYLILYIFSTRRMTAAQLRRLLPGEATGYCPICDEECDKSREHNNTVVHQLFLAWLAVSSLQTIHNHTYHTYHIISGKRNIGAGSR